MDGILPKQITLCNVPVPCTTLDRSIVLLKAFSPLVSEAGVNTPLSFLAYMSRQPDSSQQVSQVWSCATLQDGVDHVMAACSPEDDEAALLKQLEDSQLTVHACL